MRLDRFVCVHDLFTFLFLELLLITLPLKNCGLSSLFCRSALPVRLCCLLYVLAYFLILFLQSLYY